MRHGQEMSIRTFKWVPMFLNLVESDPIVVQVSPPLHLALSQSLVRSAIGDVPLLLGGEVDCVEGKLSFR